MQVLLAMRFDSPEPDIGPQVRTRCFGVILFLESQSQYSWNKEAGLDLLEDWKGKIQVQVRQYGTFAQQHPYWLTINS